MASLPTIAIATPDRPQGWMLINASDFDPAIHRAYGAEEEQQSLGPLVEPSQGIGDRTLTQLRALATAEKIPGRSAMDRDELLEALQAKGYEL